MRRAATTERFRICDWVPGNLEVAALLLPMQRLGVNVTRGMDDAGQSRQHTRAKRPVFDESTNRLRISARVLASRTCNMAIPATANRCSHVAVMSRDSWIDGCLSVLCGDSFW
jgi:hypothetical protein